jgi:tetratricopeptide (TPR) repeat protein
LTKSYTTNVEAYQLYLKGRFHLFKLTPAGIQTGTNYFQQAIDIDPNYALAYVGLAAANRALVLSADMRPNDFFPKAKAAAEKAIQIDDSLAEAHAVLGFTIFWYDWDWAAAEKEFKRALELNPNSADAHWGYAHLLSNYGRHPEALAEIKRARELDPLSLIINASEGLYLIDAGRPDDGLASLQKTMEIEPNFWFAHMFASYAYSDKGMYDQAVAEAKRARELNPGSSQPPSLMAYALAKSGRQAEARAILDEMIRPADGHFVPPFHIALIYNGLGDREQTLAWLDRGLSERDPKMTFLKVDRKWSSLNDDQHFQEIVKKVGL